MENGIYLRPLTEQDGPAVADLTAKSADGGRVSFTPVYQIDPLRAAQAAHEDWAGVAACAPGYDGLVGLGLVRFGYCQFEGERHPYALLNTLIVHPQYRHQGVASQIARWRIEQARERYGMDAVILANIQTGNTGSEKTASHWMRQMLGPLTYMPIKVRTAPPPPLAGYTVCAVAAEALDPVARALNTFYGDYNLFPRESARQLAEWLQSSPFDTPIHHYVVAVDAAGQPQAGMALTEEYRLRTLRVNSLPPSIRLINAILHLLPADGEMCELYADRIWYNPGQIEAARFLVESVLWQWRGRATNLSVAYDPHGALGALFSRRRWTPTTQLSIAIQAPQAAPPERLFYPIF